ncbi:MAG TPA: polyketide synthase dehydratase domain-containing protein, partial [Polyangiales bacterium]
PLTEFYPALRARGLEYGAAFQGLTELRRAGEVAYGRALLPEALRAGAETYGVHPALLDAALHPLFALGLEELALPFAFSEVRLLAAGAHELRTRVERRAGRDGMHVRVHVSDGLGQPVLAIESLSVRPARAEQLRASQPGRSEELYRIALVPVHAETREPRRVVLLTQTGSALADTLRVPTYAELDTLLAQLMDQAAPDCLVVDATCVAGVVNDAASDLASAAQRVAAWGLGLLQRHFAEPRLAQSELLFVTRAATGSGPDWDVQQLACAPLWGLLRAARKEQPQRALRALDLGHEAVAEELLRAAIEARDEPELYLRGGGLHGARLLPAHDASDVLQPAADANAWAIQIRERGQLDSLHATELAQTPLGPREVRVGVRAAGVNFRDVLNVLGMVPPLPLGVECAGVVLELGSEVRSLSVGQRVMGMAFGSFATHVVTDERLLVRIPPALSFAQ